MKLIDLHWKKRVWLILEFWLKIDKLEFSDWICYYIILAEIRDDMNLPIRPLLTSNFYEYKIVLQKNTSTFTKGLDIS